MSDIDVNYGALQNTSDGLRLADQNLLEKLDGLKADLRRLEGWQGEAKAAFSHNMAVFEAELDNLRAVIGRTGMAVSSAGDSYRGEDRRQAGRFLG